MKRSTRMLIVTGTVAGLMLVAAAALAAPAQPVTTEQAPGYAAAGADGAQVGQQVQTRQQDRARIRARKVDGQGQGRGPGLGVGARAGHGRTAGFRHGAGFGPAEGRGLKRGPRDCTGKGKPYHCDQS